MVDSMALRKLSIYNQGTLSGFCDYGGVIAEGGESLASEALVFLLVPLKGTSRQYIIGYFLIDKVTAQVQVELVKTALTLTAERKIRVCNVTCDGCSSNTSTLKLLGCVLDLPDPTVSFKHPTLEEQVYVTLDICHMIKLARNALAEMGAFIDANGGKISWQYITALVNLQDKLGLHLGNYIICTKMTIFLLKA